MSAAPTSHTTKWRQQLHEASVLEVVRTGFQAPKPSEKLHGSKHSQAPVASGLDILDEDDRKPGCDPDKLSALFTPVVNLRRLIRCAVSS